MRTPRTYAGENGGTSFQNMQNCNCCPYGYHIDLDFIRYCESFARVKPSDGQLLRRDRRRSRKSVEFMLGLENLFEHWEPNDRVVPVQEIPSAESDADSPKRVALNLQHNEYPSHHQHPPRSSPSCRSYGSRDSSQSRSPSVDERSVSSLAAAAAAVAITKRAAMAAANCPPPETTAFLHDALDDVVSDFERTLERTAKRQQVKRNCSSWEEYIDIIDSCVTGHKSRPSVRNDGDIALIPPPPPPRRHERDYRESSEGSSNDTHALFNIRQQMALSLKRMKDLEEQVKNIPSLQTQVISLRDEKRQMQKILQQKDDELQKLKDIYSPAPSPIGFRHKSISPTSFTPQRISPVSLESLGSRLRTTSQSSESLKGQIIKRDVGTTCQQHTKDVGVGSGYDTWSRSIGTNTLNTLGVSEALYTKRDLDEMVKIALVQYEEQRKLGSMKNLISVGTQMIPTPKIEMKSISAQTVPEKVVQKFTVGTQSKPGVKEVGISIKPEMKTVGSSDHRITDKLCDLCSVAKRTVACGPETEEKRNSVSLKQLDMPPRSMTFSLGDNEKLSLKRKSVGTQYHQTVASVATQSGVSVTSVGVQNVPAQQSQACQSLLDSVNQQTDTRDLIRVRNGQTNTAVEVSTKKDSSSNTDRVGVKEAGVNTTAPARTKTASSNTDPIRLQVEPVKVSTISISSNTDVIRTKDNAVNTAPVKTKHMSSNTDYVNTKDIGCGDVVKPHISIACADNYCDSCKDAIKNLAKGFTKVPASPILGRDSRIPRPKGLTSPSPNRKVFVRQNTYTLTPSPSPSPVAGNTTFASSLNEKPTSASLESVATTPSPLSTRRQRNDSDRMSRSFTEDEVKLASLPGGDAFTQEDGSIFAKEEIRQRTSWVKDLPLSPQEEKTEPESDDTTVTSTTGSSADNNDKKDIESQPTVQQPQQPNAQNPESSQRAQQEPTTMLLTRIATSTSLPREKNSPSKEMKAALKVINDSLQKFTSKSSNLKSANAIVQSEWFRISSTDTANPLDVEDYLDCFEEYSNAVLKYIVNLTDSNGNTAMHYAVSHGNFDVVSILLDSKVCNVNQMNNAGYTCVMLVSLAKLKNSAHRTVVQRLFQMADVNLRAKKHCQTALMLAVSHGNLDMVEMLLAAGADINIQDEDGSTALMCAAEHGRIDIVKHLLSQADCDSLIQDVDNSTAFKIAWQAGHRDIGLLLYVHEQMLRSKMPSGSRPESRSPRSPRHHRRQPST